MNDLQSELIALLPFALTGTAPVDKVVLPSTNLFSEARSHCVSALLYSTVSSSDEDFQKKWKAECLGTVYQFHRMLDVQSILTELLISNGITPVILKGTASGSAYPHPELRAYGDIDFLVKGSQFDEAMSLLQKNGFQVKSEIHGYSRHIKLEKNGVELEFHKYWCKKDFWDSSVHSDELNQRLYDTIPVEASLFNHRFFMLPPLENGIVILQHINHHISHGLGLRQILDWMMYVKTHVTDDNWNSEFRDVAEYYGLKQLAVITSHMCMMYLGLEERNWYKDADENTCQELMDYILSSGNFGANLAHGTGTKVQTVISSSNNLSGYFRHFQHSGIVHWPAAEKHRCLRPFAWIYGLGRYIVLGLKRKKPLKTLYCEIRVARNHKKMLHRIRAK